RYYPYPSRVKAPLGSGLSKNYSRACRAAGKPLLRKLSSKNELDFLVRFDREGYNLFLKITAQEEYGLRCILQLARQDPSSPLMVRDIAEREGLSVAYVEKLLWTLSRGGIAESVRGPKGGYRLTRPPTEISIGEVMRILGGIPSKDEICA